MLVKRTSIAIIAMQYSVVIRGLEKKLGDLGYKVNTIENFLDGIQGSAEETDMYIIYTPDNIVKDELKLKKLDMIVKMTTNTGKRTMIIGEKKCRDEMLDLMPEIEKFIWQDKPIDMENLELIIENALSEEAIKEINSRKRILIVDDDPSYAKMVREWLREDYRVDIVTAGMKAIGFFAKLPEGEKIDLVLLDYEMPDVNGAKVLKMLRDAESTRNLSVVFLTGNSDKEAVQKVMELKPEGYILKSTTRDGLLEYITAKLR